MASTATRAAIEGDRPGRKPRHAVRSGKGPPHRRICRQRSCGNQFQIQISARVLVICLPRHWPTLLPSAGSRGPASDRRPATCCRPSRRLRAGRKESAASAMLTPEQYRCALRGTPRRRCSGSSRRSWPSAGSRAALSMTNDPQPGRPRPGNRVHGPGTGPTLRKCAEIVDAKICPYNGPKIYERSLLHLGAGNAGP